MRFIAATAIPLALCSLCSADDADIEALLKQSEEPLQKQLVLIAEALTGSGEASLGDRLAALHDATSDKGEIVKQIAIFAAGPGEGQPVLALGILQTLELPPSVVIRTLAPYLDASNKKVRSFVRDWFQSHDNAGPTSSRSKPLNYGDYFGYVRAKMAAHETVPAAFVDYMFERSPGEALLVFDKADRLRSVTRGAEGRNPRGNPIALAEHVVSNAIWYKRHGYAQRFQGSLPDAENELRKLAAHEEWWVRLYVVQIMRLHPEFREPAVLARLTTDAYAPVSEIAKSLR